MAGVLQRTRMKVRERLTKTGKGPRWGMVPGPRQAASLAPTASMVHRTEDRRRALFPLSVRTDQRHTHVQSLTMARGVCAQSLGGIFRQPAWHKPRPRPGVSDSASCRQEAAR